MDVRDPSGWTGRPDKDDQADQHRTVQDWPGGSVALVGPGADEAAVRSAWVRLGGATDGVWRLTVQPLVPHVELHFRPPASTGATAEAVLTPLRELATTLVDR